MLFVVLFRVEEVFIVCVKLAVFGVTFKYRFRIQNIMENTIILKKIAAQLRKDVVTMIGEAGSGHPGGSFSIAELMTVLYFGRILNYDPKDPKWADRDRVVLSKGHCSPMWYASLAYAGFFPKKDLMTLRKFGSHLQGHCHPMHTPGVENSGGPLGQGLSFGLGHAIAGKIDGRDYKTYVIIGDGESAKGNITEAAKMAGILKMNNLIAFIDFNKVDQEGFVKDILPCNFKQEWESYGWEVVEADGHSVDSVYSAVEKARCSDKPCMVLLDTLKGQGVTYMEDAAKAGDSAWHGVAPKEELLERAISELDKQINDLDGDVDEYIKKVMLSKEEKEKLSKTVVLKTELLDVPYYEKGSEAPTRGAFGKYLEVLGEGDERVVAVTAGVGGSVKMKGFGKKFGVFSSSNYKGRFVDCGIAEANMAGVAAGLAAAGKKPWMATFDIFMKEMLSVIRNCIGYAHTDVKIIGTHGGLGVEPDGGSHQSMIEPLLFETMPGFDVYEPCDPNEAMEAMKVAASMDKPAYFRMTRQKLDVLERDYKVEKGKGAYVLKDGKDLTILVSGGMVGYVLEAASVLEKEGVNVKVIDLLSITNIDNEDFRSLVLVDKNVVTLSDASYKVLGDVVSRVLSSPESKFSGKIKSLGMQGYGESGKVVDLYKKHGMDVDSIVKVCKKLV
jgi:transketolase